ncbi:uncharacterized protein BDR25DRAFT_353254 [Lindgomyces ingoldianus]|uniref:Uncharacterized protein n=1 Tax=Lindgomyces ingoldianus TaxID=673940 RepID=A0ACB6R2C7_9PLEO|nr:uncharacterized protein BDR25DRAFT_353254 [Lindgomyces ingoldianus]KAF2472945.1 hypothetical protein BDR25DRAFT_353254 [Lindgomyces ingoldianus]
MSTCKGTVISEKEQDQICSGISSVMAQDMSGKRYDSFISRHCLKNPLKQINNYCFNIDTMTSFEGDTSPYLQYSHARLCSILLKAGVPTSKIKSANLNLLVKPHAINVVQLITYSYYVLQVVRSERELIKAQLALYNAAKSVINNRMRLPDLIPLDRFRYQDVTRRSRPPLKIPSQADSERVQGMPMSAVYPKWDCSDIDRTPDAEEPSYWMSEPI